MTEKKPLETLIAEHNQHRKLWSKSFRHIKSGTSYQLIRTAHDTETQELCAVYCLNAMSILQFTRPMSEFLEKCEEAVG